LKHKESYRWLICMAATLILFCTIGLTISSFSIYLPYIRGQNGFDNTQTSMLLTIRSVTSLLVLFQFDRYYRKFGMRMGITLSLFFLVGGFILYGLSESYLSYCLSAMLMGVANGLSSSTAATLLINSWFRDQKALALGISSAGTGIASIVAPLILVPIIEEVSLAAAFFTVSGFILVCALIIFFIVRNDSPIQLVVKGQSAKKESKPTEPVKLEEKRQMLIVSPFMGGCFMVAVFLGAVLVYGITGCLSLVLQPNFSGTDMSRIVSIYGLFLMLGKILFGQLTDKLGAFRANFFMFISLLIGLPLICIARSFALAAFAAACLGLGSPISNVSTPLYVSDLSVKAHYPRVLKISNMVMNCAGIFTTSVVGPVADLFGGYIPVFAGLGVIGLICGALFQIVYINAGLTGKARA